MNTDKYLTNIPDEFTKFTEAVRTGPPVPVQSITVVGSVLTPDFLPGTSDINSIVVVDAVTIELLDFMVPLGREYRRHGIGAPLLMTPEYIGSSLDVFPIEFFNYREIHYTVSGSDPLQDLAIDRRDLRLQCEREMKSKLLWLHQGYMGSLGEETLLVEQLKRSITGYLPLFRAILHLADHSLTLSAHDTARAVEEILGLDTSILTTILELKKSNQAATDRLCDCFASYYQATQRLSEYVETFPA
jgi:hypothetical protein